MSTKGHDFVFNLAGDKRYLPNLSWTFHWHSSTGQKVLSYANQGNYHWLRFPSLADFRISKDTRKATCYPIRHISRITIRHLFLDQVLPRCLAYQGRIMLHASAVQHEQGLILFVGDSKSGKSTLAGNFHQFGIPAVADDCLLVKEKSNLVLAVPTYGGLRLWEDSLDNLFPPKQPVYSMAHYSRKKRLILDETPSLQIGEGIPVLAVIVLVPADQVYSPKIFLERITYRATFIALLKQTFQLNLKDLERVKDHVNLLGRLVPKLNVFRLTLPREYDLLPIARQKILETVL